MKKRYLIVLMALVSLGCQDYLQQKPDKALVVPTSLADMNDLLNNSAYMNDVPALGVLAGDEYFMPKSGLDALNNQIERNTYFWAKDLYEGTTFAPDWTTPYRQVFYANVVLEGLEKITPQQTQQTEWNRLKGSALFFRAWAFYHLAQGFAGTYDQATAEKLLGIPLKLQADINTKAPRGTLQQTYERINQDLALAARLLPVKTAVPTQPGKPAAYGLLARVHHTMEEYPVAALYADSALALKNQLLDYSTVDSTLARPMPRSILNANPEVLFQATLVKYGFFSSSLIYPDTVLAGTFEANDLRKSLFFQKGTGRFIGTYTGTAALFAGLATDEMLLIRSECAARLGQESKALGDLNKLLVTRYKQGTYKPITEARPLQLLELILLERRKQLFSRGVRWADLRRLNKDPRFAKTLYRKPAAELLELPANDNRYVLSIPENEILGSGIEQNLR